MDIPSAANLFGFLAIVAYILTLLPTTLRVISPPIKKTGIPKLLLQNRRLMGILAFALTVAHGHLMLRKRHFDFLDHQTYVVYCQGIITFIIFASLTITSNDWSVRKLKKHWKMLHSLTYIAMFLLLWHVFDKMDGHWTYLTPISAVGMVGIVILFLLRKIIEIKKSSLPRSTTLGANTVIKDTQRISDKIKEKI
ncbi:MAG: ferric reductase-like transmembrane domain-containing protein [Cyanobacteria bacterium P01_G01_bin.49]